MVKKANKLEQVTYCGLYCGLCSHRNRVPKQAGALRETMKKEGWEYWGKEETNFKEFWRFLKKLAEMEPDCSCRTGKCGPPFCGIRKCAEKKGLDACPFCNEYPCYRILGIAEGYVNLLGDGKRMKEKRLDVWIAEQEERRKTGFAYSDIRNQPYSISDK
jgi:hypothetical protein